MLRPAAIEKTEEALEPFTNRQLHVIGRNVLQGCRAISRSSTGASEFESRITSLR